MKIIYGKNAITNVINKNTNNIDSIYIINKKSLKLKKDMKYINVPEFIKNKLKYSKNIYTVIKTKSKNFNEKINIENIFKIMKNPFFLILDRIQDPNNFGACIRIAETAGIDIIIIPKNKSAKLSSLITKISCGATLNVKVISVGNIVKTIQIIKKYNINIIGMSAHSDKNLYKEKLKKPICIIIGSEIDGIKKKIKENCNKIIKIPSFGKNKILNLAVATGITLFEIQRQNSLIKY